MNPTSLTIERGALSLALDLASAEDCRISSMALSTHFGEAADRLIVLGLIRADGQVSSIELRDGGLATVVWSQERSGFGFFSEEDGWVNLSHHDVGIFSLQIDELARRLTVDLDLQPSGTFNELRQGLFWDMGYARLPGLMKRVSIWVARRLHDPDVRECLHQAALSRPPRDLRLILSLSNAEISGWTLANQVIASVSSLASVADPFKIDAAIASARLRLPVGSVEEVTLSADGGHLVVHGRSYRFRGVRQRAVVRQLVEARKDGEAQLLTQNALNEAGCGLSVRRLANVFKGHPDWHEVIREEAGFCWLQA